MQIIPAINCENFECVKEKLQKVAEFFSDLPAGASQSGAKEGWAQIDIADGKFTPHKTWNNPSELVSHSKPNIEIHLMVENPLEVIDDWIKSGARRMIVHYEAICKEAGRNDSNDEIDIINFLLEKCANQEVEFGLAINPDTPVDEIIFHLDRVRFIQILAVNPGLAGQQFQAITLQKIKFLKELNDNYSNVIIEVDGGINLEIAKMCKEAGADILISSSYIWSGENPKNVYKELVNL